MATEGGRCEGIPVPGALYDCYDDGKVCWDRHYLVRILGPVRLADLPAGRRREAEEDIEGCYWLFASLRNQGILYDSLVMGGDGSSCLRGMPHELFARSRDGGWFGVGAKYSGRLDVSGEATACLERDMPPLGAGVTVASGGVHVARSRGRRGS